jgi:hypothetical protein
MKIVQNNHINMSISDEDMLKVLRLTPEQASEILGDNVIPLKKGGPGSGKTGHKTPKNPVESYISNIQSQKFAGKAKTKSGKPIAHAAEHGTASGYESQDHKDAANYHYEAAQKLQLHPKKEQMQPAIKQHVSYMKQHLASANKIDSRQAKTLADSRAKKKK